MNTKDDFLKLLRDDPMYRNALKMAKTDAERKQVIAATEEFVERFASVLVPAIQRAKSDPNYVNQLRLALQMNEHVVNDSEESSD